MNTQLINDVQEMFPDIAHLYDAADPQEWIDASMQAILETQNEEFEYLYDELDRHSQCRHTYTFEITHYCIRFEKFDIVHTPEGYFSKAFREYACDKLEELTGLCAERMVLRETEVHGYFSVDIKTDTEMCWEVATEKGFGETPAGHQGAIDDAREEMNWAIAEEFGKLIAE